MGFEKEYTIYSTETHSVSNEKSTFLGFFGFDFSSGEKIHYHTSPDKIVLDPNDDGGYTVRKKTGSTSSSTTKYVKFSRSVPYDFQQSKEGILEDRFYRLVKDKYSEHGYFSPGMSPYLYKSVKDYYQKGYQLELWLPMILGVLPTIIYALIGCIFQGIAGLMYCLISGLVWSVVVLLISIPIEKTVTKIITEELFPFDTLSLTKKEKVRDKYLNSLDVGIEEANAILREYAILKGYDKI